MKRLTDSAILPLAISITSMITISDVHTKAIAGQILKQNDAPSTVVPSSIRAPSALAIGTGLVGIGIASWMFLATAKKRSIRKPSDLNSDYQETLSSKNEEQRLASLFNRSDYDASSESNVLKQLSLEISLLFIKNKGQSIDHFIDGFHTASTRITEIDEYDQKSLANLEKCVYIVYSELSSKARQLLRLVSWLGEDIPQALLDSKIPWDEISLNEVSQCVEELALNGLIIPKSKEDSPASFSLLKPIQIIIQRWQQQTDERDESYLALEWVYEAFKETCRPANQQVHNNAVSRQLISILNNCEFPEHTCLKVRAYSMLIDFSISNQRTDEAALHSEALQIALEKDHPLDMVQVGTFYVQLASINHNLDKDDAAAIYIEKAWTAFQDIDRDLPLHGEFLLKHSETIREIALETGNIEIFTETSVNILKYYNALSRHQDALEFAKKCTGLNQDISFIIEIAKANGCLGNTRMADQDLGEIINISTTADTIGRKHESDYYEILGKHRLERKEYNLSGFNDLIRSLNTSDQKDYHRVTQLKTEVARHAIIYLNKEHEKYRNNNKFQGVSTQRSEIHKWQRQDLFQIVRNNLSDAVSLAQEHRDHLGMAFILNTLCWEAKNEDQLVLIRNCLSIVRNVGDSLGESTILHQLGKCLLYIQSQRQDRFSVLCNASYSLNESIKIKSSLQISPATSHHQLARVELDKSKLSNGSVFLALNLATVALEYNYKRYNRLMNTNWKLVKQIWKEWKISSYQLGNVSTDEMEKYGIPSFKRLLRLSTKDIDNNVYNDYQYGRIIGFWGLGVINLRHLGDKEKAKKYLTRAEILFDKLALANNHSDDKNEVECLILECFN